MDIHSYTSVYIHIHTYTYIYYCIHTYTYPSKFGLGERDSVNGLHTQPILVANVNSREELEGSADIRNGLQPVQHSVEIFCAEMAMRAV